jgi:hypothetical protein
VKQKHTPGSWEVQETQRELQVITLPGGAIESVVIADCNVSLGKGWLTEGETLANARLIAAAPEMLEALERIAQGNTKFGPEVEARNAIAKAEGGK